MLMDVYTADELDKIDDWIENIVDDNKVMVEFKEKQRAVTKGQAVVFYDGDIVVGGGTIR